MFDSTLQLDAADVAEATAADDQLCPSAVAEDLPEPDRLTEGEQRAWRAYLEGSKLLMHRLDQQLQRDSGITLTDFELLLALSDAPGGTLRMSELADAILATRSGVTRAVARLVTAGLVERVQCEGDGRGTNAQLTDKGRLTLANSAPGHVSAVRNAVFDPLDPAELESMQHVNGLIRDRLLADGREAACEGA